MASHAPLCNKNYSHLHVIIPPAFSVFQHSLRCLCCFCMSLLLPIHRSSDLHVVITSTAVPQTSTPILMTVPEKRRSADEDDDSFYDDAPVPNLRNSSIKSTQLELTHTDVRELDSALDEEDEQHENDQLENDPLSSSSYTGKVDILSDVGSPRPSHVPAPPFPSSPPPSLRNPAGSPGIRSAGDSNSNQDSQVPEFIPSKRIDIVDDDDVWFDSDENNVEVESLDSSSSMASSPVPPAHPSQPANHHVSSPVDDPDFSVPIVSSLETPRKPSSPTPNFGGLSLLTRASQTFYKAFRKRKPAPPRTSKPRNAASVRSPISDNLDTIHEGLEELLEAQIATLRSARTGFVDLKLVKPMIQRTLDAVNYEGKSLLSDFSQLEERAETLQNQVVGAERDAEEEVASKEQLLVESKMKLAEASAEFEQLQHELRGIRKIIQEPKRQRQRQLEETRRGACVCREACVAVEQRLEDRRQALSEEKAQLQKLETGYRDMEGDWQ